MLPLPETLIEMLQDAVWQCSADGERLISINAASERLFMRSSENLRKVWWRGIVHPEDQQQFSDMLAQVALAPQTLEIRFLMPHGEFHRIEQTCCLSEDRRLIAVARDASAARAAESLRQMQASYQSLVDSLPLNLIIKDRQGRRVFANQRYLETHKLSLDQVLGKTDHDIFPSKLADKYTADDQHILATGEVLHHTEEIQLPAGRCWIERIKGPARDADGNIIGIQLLYWDITEKHNAELALEQEKFLLHTLLDNIPDAIYFKDQDSRFMRISSSMAVKSLLPSANAAEGLTDADIFTQEHALQARQDELEVMRTGSPIISRIEKETWPDRPDTWVSTTKMPLRDGLGNIVGTFGITRDVTDLRNAQEDLRRTRDEANAANRAKSDFLANMSHEIRTPMNGIIGMSELLTHTQLSLEQRDYLDLIRQSADSLLRLLNDILDFSKIEAGKLELEEIPLEIRNCVGKTMQTLTLRSMQKNLELACRIAPDVPDALIGDPGRLRQVIVNLVGNAIKFTEHGEVALEVTLDEALPDQNKARLKFKVSDTGIGIPEHRQHSVFEAFTQVDSSTTRKYGGTGLGLAISSQLVGMMNGSIWLESQIGKGTTFYFTIEFVIGEARFDTQEAERASLHNLPILVVDDNDTNRRILDELLKHWRVKVRSVAEGAAALIELRRAAAIGHPYRLALLDCMMPEMDGFMLADLIRRDPKLAEMPMIMLSSAARSGDSTRCRELGISRYMTKPVVQSELFDAILAVFEKNRPAKVDRHIDHSEWQVLPKLRILLAEDGFVNQRVAVGILEAAGHEVLVANNGIEAISKWEQHDVDLILMDMQMPEMDGLEATAVIRLREVNSGEHVPIIALTAAAMKGDAERCLESGMDAYVSKPMDPRVLFETMAAELRSNESKLRKIDTAVTPRTSRAVPSASEPQVSTEIAGKVINFDAPARIIPGGPPAIKRLAEVFLSESTQLLADIRASIAAHDAVKLRRAAHTLKGSAALFEAERVRQIAYDLEVIGRNNHFEPAAELLLNLEQHAAKMHAALRAYLAN